MRTDVIPIKVVPAAPASCHVKIAKLDSLSTPGIIINLPGKKVNIEMPYYGAIWLQLNLLLCIQVENMRRYGKKIKKI